MAKGFSTQSAMVLLEHAVSLDALMAALEPLGRLQRDERAEPGWMSKPNVRLFQLTPEWSVMDTIGMEQLDATDHEACFRTSVYDPGAVDGFLRSISLYVFQNGPVIQPGNTADGPGDVRWEAQPVETSLAPQPRPVLRWVPQDGSRPPLSAG